MTPDASTDAVARLVFECYDTYGLPLEFMEQVLEEEDVPLDRDAFERALEEQRARGRAGSTMGQEAIVFKREMLSEKALERLRRENLSTDFVGYESTESETTVLAILVGDEWRDQVDAGTECQVLLDRTPFYARSGGQVGDVGGLATDGGLAIVSDTVLDHQYIVHQAKIEKGYLRRGDCARATVDGDRRLATARNHTATHLLQWALRTVLGDHVHQAGSEVGPERFRFDFTQPTALTPEERRLVEDMVNQRILEGVDVEVRQMPLEEARSAGAMALFGEKYGHEVRVVSIGEFSKELCGGTHLDNISEIGLVKITGEESVAAGVRRITAVSGSGALQYLHEQEEFMAAACRAVKAGPDTLLSKIEALQRQVKDLKADVAQARSLTKRGGGIDDLLAKVQDVGGLALLVAEVEGADANALREACDALRQKRPSLVAVLASREADKTNLVALATQDLVAKGVHAGNLVRAVAKEMGGGGGGRPDFAQAGAKNPDALPGALAKVPELVKAQLSGKK